MSEQAGKTTEGKMDELERLKQEISGLKERLLWLQADFDNYRKQVAQELAGLVRQVQDQEILDFLPVYDALEQAFRTLEHNNDLKSFVEGVERIFAQLAGVLKRKGCQPFDSVGRYFDPAYHEVLVTAHSEVEKNVILEEFERGWLREGRVLRPARVKVSLGPKEG